jgi:hypothetical protein
VKSGRILALLVFGPALCALANAQNGCGDTLNWTASTCQVIGSGQLNTAMVNGANDPNAWTVISRHGEYMQGETECNIPAGLLQGTACTGLSGSPGCVTIDTQKPGTGPICGDWDIHGNIYHSSSSTLYTTGDFQWNTFNFKYGTVVIRQKLPAQSTRLWVGEWLLGANCQNSNKYTGDTGVNTCPGISASAYDEIDLLETKYLDGSWGNNWGVVRGAQQSERAFNQSPLDTNWHVYTVNWCVNGQGACNFTGVRYTICDSAGANCAGTGTDWNVAPTQQNMFLILQTQTSPSVSTDNATAGQVLIDYVKVCDSNVLAANCNGLANNDSHVIFYDDFNGTGTGPAPPTGLTAVVK